MKISILMPMYGGLLFAKESIDSVLSQTYNDFELLIGINGCNKKTIKYIIKELSYFIDDRVKIFYYPERGKSKTLNSLLKESTGELIALLDIDDKWDSSKLQKQIQFIDKYDVIGTNAEYFGDKSGEPGIFLGKISAEMFSWQNPIINSSVLMKKIDSGWDEKFEGIDDFAKWIELLHDGKTFYNLPESLTFHRLYRSSSYNNSNTEMAKKLLSELPVLNDEQFKNLEDIRSFKKWKL